MSLGYINPIAFHLFTKPIYWYGIIIATTVLVAYLMAEREASKRGLPKDTMLDLFINGSTSSIYFRSCLLCCIQMGLLFKS